MFDENEKSELLKVLIYFNNKKLEQISLEKEENFTKIFSSSEPRVKFFKFDSSFSYFFANSAEIVSKYSISANSIKKVQKYFTKFSTCKIWIHPFSDHLVW